MAKTINFCGDSFCAIADKADAWPAIVAKTLEATIIGLGEPGTAHEHAIKSFNPAADYTIFCWTEPHRLYHPNYPISILSSGAHKDTSPVYQAAYQFYKYLHTLDYFIERQQRDFYWFENTQLIDYKGVIIHLWGFDRIYDWKIGKSMPKTLTNIRAFVGNGKINHLNLKGNLFVADSVLNLIGNS